MAARRTLRIGLVPGDGIGRDVIPAAQRVLEALPRALGLRFDFVPLDVGFDTFRRTGAALHPHTVDALRDSCHGALFGAVSSPSVRTPGYSSPIVALRKQLALYANVRPVKSATAAAAAPVDMVIVRENTEDLYVKEERSYAAPDGSEVAEATKRISERATAAIARMAGDIALRRRGQRAASSSEQPTSVTITHKANVLPQTDGLFLRTAQRVLAAPPYDSLALHHQIVDSMVYRLFREPAAFDVVVAPNLYGDILSDGAAALVGSLGVVPSANVGDGFVMGEPCHGSAPDLAGAGVANPVAAIRSAALMLEFLGEDAAARAVLAAVDAGLVDGAVTPDLGGTASTADVTEDVCRRL